MRRRAPIVLAAGAALLASAAPGLGATTVRIDAQPRVGVQAGGHLWIVADRGDARVLIEADRLSGRPTGRQVTIAASGVPFDGGLAGQNTVRPSLTVAGGALWTIDSTTTEAVRVDPVAARTTLRVDLGPGEVQRYIAAGPAGLWVTAPTVQVAAGFARRLVRLDPATGAQLGEVRIGPGSTLLREIAVGRGGIWANRHSGNSLLLRIPSPAGAATETRAGQWQLFARRGTLYSTRRNTCRVSVSPWNAPARTFAMCASGTVAYVRDVASAGGAVWWTAFRAPGRPGVLARRAADGTGPVRRWPVGSDPVDVVPAGAGVWVLSRADRTLTRITP